MVDNLDDLIEIEKVDFDNGIIEAMEIYKKQINKLTYKYNKLLKTFDDIEYYKQHGYNIKYYIDGDNGITYKAIKKQIGFKPKGDD